MKNFTKVIIITALIIFFVGILLALTSLALGANPKLIINRLDNMGISNIYFSSHERFFSHNYDYDYGYDYDYDYGYDYDYDSDHYNNQDSSVTLPEEPHIPIEPETPQPFVPGEYDITELRFNFDAGDINIKLGDDFQLIYEGARANSYFYEKREGNVWTIGSRSRNWRLWDFWRHDGDDLSITVVLPKDFVAKRMDISLDAGNMRAGLLQTEELYLDVGLGNCQISRVLAESADVNVGLGNLDVRDFHASIAQLEVGMGAMKLWLAQPLSQYRCNLDVGLGNIALGNNNYSGVADISTGNVDSPYNIDISCGIGSITVREAAASI